MEQLAILHRFLKIENEDAELKDELTHQQSLLKKLRQQILQEAIEGRLTAAWRAQNPDVEPARELLKRIAAEKAQLVKEKKIKEQKPLPPISDKEKPFELPQRWEWCRLEDSGLFERGKSKHRPRNDLRLFEGGHFPFVQTGDVARSKRNGYKVNTFSQKYNDIGLAQSRVWPKGTLCITIAANIAETGFLGLDACFPDSVVGFTSIADLTDPFYVKYFIDATKDEIEKFAPATAQKNINLGIINMLSFPLPPLDEQQAIVAKVEQLFVLCDQLENQISHNQNHAEQLMQAVLKEAFNHNSTVHA
ncbi:MAG: type I site-specific deoxyribonuclease [Anaerolineaceae bacterium]|nr:type I site-specific deoxyribonuclease [Anaerolineaceae bacterium]